MAENFRESSRARTDAEFVSKLGIVEQELDESLLWLELLVETEIVDAAKLAPLCAECEELLKVVVTAIKRSR